MAEVVWIHADPDPFRSGELRRLGVPALAMEAGAWRSSFVHKDRAASIGAADVAVVPLAAIEILPLLGARGVHAIVLEIDEAAADMPPEAFAALEDLKGRIAAVAVHGGRARRKARAALGPAIPIWTFADAAARLSEQRAAAIRFGVAIALEPPPNLPDRFELWFAEAGDTVQPREIESVVERWSGPAHTPRVAIAPRGMLEWLRQAGVGVGVTASSPFALDAALPRAQSVLLPEEGDAASVRRRRLAQRYGAPVEDAVGPRAGEACDPKALGAAWRAAIGRLSHAAARRQTGQITVMAFLDLVQDLDLILPLIDELAAMPDIRLRAVISTWLEERSPRVTAELEARGIIAETVAREAVTAGLAPGLDEVDALISVVETSDPAHARTHSLFRRAKDRGVPTFSLQHGLENVGLTYFEGASPEIVSDHLFAWFDRDRAPTGAPSSLKARLVHVGRPSQKVRAGDLAALFGGFDRVAAVFENLHWDRYDEGFRTRFLEDCVEFAQAFPATAVLIKPHHAGVWAAKNRSALPQWTPNLVMADPTDPFWEPFTAPSLIGAADLVITTPSTVALDAALAGKPVAVAAYGMDLPAFAPLPLLQSAADWAAFARDAGSVDGARRRARFVERTTLDGCAEQEAARYLVAAADQHRRLRRREEAEVR